MNLWSYTGVPGSAADSEEPKEPSRSILILRDVEEGSKGVKLIVQSRCRRRRCYILTGVLVFALILLLVLIIYFTTSWLTRWRSPLVISTRISCSHLSTCAISFSPGVHFLPRPMGTWEQYQSKMLDTIRLIRSTNLRTTYLSFKNNDRYFTSNKCS